MLGRNLFVLLDEDQLPGAEDLDPGAAAVLVGVVAAGRARPLRPDAATRPRADHRAGRAVSPPDPVADRGAVHLVIRAW